MSLKLRYLYRAYRYRWRVDPAEIRFVCESLKPGQVAVDIGCHKGAYTYWMRRCVGPSGAIYAFEPQPKQVAYLHEAFGNAIRQRRNRADGRLESMWRNAAARTGGRRQNPRGNVGIGE